MSGLFGTLNNATKGLNVQQSALQTTSHNISNANTEGYSRQKVNMVADNPYTLGGIGQLGTGVRIASIDRIVDPYVNNQLRNENSSLEMYNKKSEVLGQLEGIFNEPSTTGLNNNLSKVFASWTYLGSNPELATAKTMVAQNAETFTDTLHHMSNQIDSLHEDTVQDIEKNVIDFNAKVQQLDSLNQQIFNMTSQGQAPNDLLDQQDKLLGELTGIAGVEASYDKFNRVSITVGGESVLTEDSIAKMSVAADRAGQLTVNDKNVDITSGNIKGSQEALSEIDTKKQELNELAFTFATAVNTVHSDGGEGLNFFELGTDGNYAASIQVNKEILADVSKINAGKNIESVVGGDGTRAQAIASLQNTKLGYPVDPTGIEYDSDTMTIKNQVGGSTVSGAYNDSVTQMGIVKQQADNMVDSQGSLVSLLEARRDSVSSVSINEEVTNTITYQSAFEANSRIISVVSEMLDTLINRTGV
ncbi:flagellar hook-associated protein FlgK [Carnobacterium inhibens]|uniref:Flagellar hook-associated protein 1 n=1 Tax=Carnobacterium inhibens subsp. gilichinskyi TaxID=1266845 RepID=U5SER1_9LACT|nr:flagellar hook-associated protein FlgK [Carnobacterium inhibens]AGY82357.1 flagellar hook protein [Carnobacterium inhibens subsp. gilichinskyi]